MDWVSIVRGAWQVAGLEGRLESGTLNQGRKYSHNCLGAPSVHLCVLWMCLWCGWTL